MRLMNPTGQKMLRSRQAINRYRHRRGYSLVEAVLAAFLATMLGLLLATSCATFGRPALEVDARARITQEGILAAQSIACDLGGFLGDSLGRTGTTSQYVLIGWSPGQGNVLVLSYQGATTSTSDVLTVSYQQSGNQLVRYDSASGVTTTIANCVTAFSVEPNPDNGSQALIQITIAFRYFTSTYTLIGVSPT
jgi:hypothetical protein